MRVLLDTCTLVWFAVNDKRLTIPARTALESLETEAFASAAPAWEITTKARKGKWPQAEELAVDIVSVVRELGFRELSVTVEHGQRAGMLPGIHNDPFDRILIAQAQAENLSVISSDRIFDYHVRRIW